MNTTLGGRKYASRCDIQVVPVCPHPPWHRLHPLVLQCQLGAFSAQSGFAAGFPCEITEVQNVECVRATTSKSHNNSQSQPPQHIRAAYYTIIGSLAYIS